MFSSRFSRILQPLWPSRIPIVTTAFAAISTSPSTAMIRNYRPQHETWPYTSSDFSRMDESSDQVFYEPERLVAHIDDAALSRLSNYYSSVVPDKGRILDLCTSWRSWYPDSCEKKVQIGSLEVFGIGMNEAEMASNPMFKSFPTRYRVVNLNDQPHDVKWPDYEKESESAPMFDCVTCAVSVDYLTSPVEVLKKIRQCTVKGGKIHLVISNRCFPTKAVKLWLESTAQERLQLVGDYLYFSGWKDIGMVDLCPTDPSLDPLWVIRGTNNG